MRFGVLTLIIAVGFRFWLLGGSPVSPVGSGRVVAGSGTVPLGSGLGGARRVPGGFQVWFWVPGSGRFRVWAFDILLCAGWLAFVLAFLFGVVHAWLAFVLDCLRAPIFQYVFC